MSYTSKNAVGTTLTFASSTTAIPGSEVPQKVLVGDTSGGLSIYRSIDVNATGVNVKSSAGQVYGWYLFNTGSQTRYVKLYNKATAPTVGTDTPVMTIPLPAGGGANVFSDIGLAFSSGIGIGATQGVADNNTSAPASNEVLAHIYYK